MPASGEFVDAVADLLVASGLGTGRYSTSGTSIQVNLRRDFGVDLTYVLLSQTGGQSFPFALREHQNLQVLVDAPTVSGARAKAREIYDFLHDRAAFAITLAGVSGADAGHRIMWLRSTTGPPQAIPIGPGGGEADRYQFSTNFEAFLLRP